MAQNWSRIILNKIATTLLRIKERARALAGLKNNKKALKTLKSLRQSPEDFDSEYYLAQLAEPLKLGVSALEHFLSIGYFQGKSGRFFDRFWYEDFHSDIRKSGIDGYFHYRNYGLAENRAIRYINIHQDIYVKRLADYKEWRDKNKNIISIEKPYAIGLANQFAIKPKFSIIVPVYDPPVEFLKKAIESVIAQFYDNWELCLADDNSPNPLVRQVIEEYAKKDNRIKYVFRPQNGHISEASNSAIEIATGDYFGLLDHDDELSPDALFFMAREININESAAIIYSDEDKIDESGNQFDPYFKCDFNYELFLAQNMISHFGVYDAELIRQIGGFRKGFEGSQDHDLALRTLEKCGKNRIFHIPRVLYHWRAIAGSTALDIGEKNYAAEAGRKAVEEHLVRMKVKASVSIADPQIGHYRVKHSLPHKLPKISIIIPTKDRIDLLQTCINSILEKSTYPNYEIIVVNNNSEREESLQYFNELKSQNIKVLDDYRSFNFSAINNDAVKNSNGEYLLFLNNDIEIISPDWLEEMLSWAQRPNIGCVGARLWYPDNTIQHAGVILGMGGVAGHAHKHLPKGHNGYFCRAIHHQILSAVTAACLMVRREIFDQVGGFEETLAVAFNDVDLCIKIREAGYDNIYTPYAQAYHHESVSRGSEDNPQKQARFKSEVDFMTNKWADILLHDPYYNCNLSLSSDDFSYAEISRLKPISSTKVALDTNGSITKTKQN